MFQTKWISVFVFLIFHSLSIKGFFIIVLHDNIYSVCLTTKCIRCGLCLIPNTHICIYTCNIIVIALYYNHYIINFIILSVIKYPNIQGPNMLPFKRINVLLFAITYLAINNTYADSFESDYNIICYTYLLYDIRLSSFNIFLLF